MNIIKFFVVIWFVKSNINIYNKINGIIIKQIENRKYTVFNLNKKYTQIQITCNENNKNLCCLLVNNILNETISNEFGYIIIDYANKSTYNIIEEIEKFIKKITSTLNIDYILLSYSQYEYRESNSIEVKKKGIEIYYENSYAADGYFDKILLEMEKFYLKNEHKFREQESTISYRRNEDDISYYFRLCVIIHNMCYLFKFDINDLDNKELNTFAEVNTRNIGHHDAKILKKLYGIFNVNDLYHIEARGEIRCLEISRNKIEKIMPKKFKIEVHLDSISFFDGYTKNSVYLKNESNKDDGEKKFINNNFFDEIKKILEKINFIANTKDYKFEFLIMRIMNKQETALKLIFNFIIKHMYIVEEDELDYTTGEIIFRSNNEEDNKNKIINKLSYRLSGLQFSDCYLIKICLLLDAEEYINKKNINNEYIWESLIDINEYIREKNNEKISRSDGKSRCISILKIIKEAENYHINNIIKYKNEVLKNVCKMTSLFTGLASSRFVYEDIKEDFIRNEICENFQLDGNEIEEKANIIKNNLQKNTDEDEEYEKKRKEMLKNSSLDYDLNIIKSNPLEEELKDIFDEDIRTYYENEQIKKGKIIIENIFNEFLKKNEIQEESINDYKNEIEDDFLQILRNNIEVRLRKQASIELPKAFNNLFKSEMKICHVEKVKLRKIFQNVKMMLDETIILEILNKTEGIKMHESFTKALDTFR
ncbi:uncharacterized protein VNE69_05002 [Vairimorpha necatrix]|uniref:Uncharacterized protein n=1 Tax=Vairimorpha necatrix TaxID=6039 RepID=A0AAX4JBQ5_9MICR